MRACLFVVVVVVENAFEMKGWKSGVAGEVRP